MVIEQMISEHKKQSQNKKGMIKKTRNLIDIYIYICLLLPNRESNRQNIYNTHWSDEFSQKKQAFIVNITAEK